MTATQTITRHIAECVKIAMLGIDKDDKYFDYLRDIRSSESFNFKAGRKLIGGIEVDGIDYRDYPDFCDSYISDMEVKDSGEWRKATEEELDEINENSEVVYKHVMLALH